ncbi:Claudin-20 [Dissostichus eleginoides]|uniref:Claudin-20 n=1 Tax=Dissostichus eleginoides TaxID=100907 RepID=A0AAD9F7W6_DISEL|nr:Claudin-20 [Dissostichus eleginoides]
MLPGSVQILAFVLALLGLLGAWWPRCSPAGWERPPAPRPAAAPPLEDAGSVDGLRITRASMVLCCLAAAFGLCLAALGLKCTKWGGGRRAKGHTAVAGGGFLVLAAFLCLGPASWFTFEVVAAFLKRPDGRRLQPGGALGLAFCASGFLLAGGVILCLSCPGLESRRPDHASNEDQDWFLVLQRRPPPPQKERKEAEVPPPKELSEKYSRHEYV